MRHTPTSDTTANGRAARAPVCDIAGCAPLTDAVMTERDAARLAPVFAALADPVRLRLFTIIAAEGEVCSCNLEAPLERSQPTISHHTRVLSEAGLIVGEKRGRWTWWRLRGDRLDALRALLGGE